MNRIFTVLFSLFSICAFAQNQFQSVIDLGGEDQAIGLDKTSDGGCVVVGKTKIAPSNFTDMFLVKLNNHGEVEWTKVYSTPLNDEPWEVAVSDDAYYVIGSRNDESGTLLKFFVMRLDLDGTAIWTKMLDSGSNSYGNGITILSDGDILATGYRGIFSTSDSWLVRLNPDGTEQWQTCFGTSTADLGGNVFEMQDGSLRFITSTQVTGEGNILLSKITADGNVEWTKHIEGNVHGSSYCLDQLPNGNLVLFGETHDMLGPDDLWMLEVTEDADVEWSKVYGNESKTIRSFSGETTQSGNVIACVYDYSQENPRAGLLLTDNEGNVMWAYSYTGDEISQSRGVVEATDGGFIMAGSITSEGNMNCLVVKADATGKSCDSNTAIELTSLTLDTEAVDITTTTAADVAASDFLFDTPGISATTSSRCIAENIEALAAGEINIYPNPAGNSKKIFIDSNLMNAGISVYDVQGRRVEISCRKSGNGFIIHDSILIPGLYTVVLENGDYRLTEKLVIE